MCSNFQPIKHHRSNWVREHFNCELLQQDWRPEIFPTYSAPFIYLKDGKPHCELAQFGLVPHWAINKPKFGLHTYNARSETVAEKPSFRSAWKARQFGLILMEQFYEPNWESGKSVRWAIKKPDGEPVLAASIWESVTDRETGEIITSFSMLTINADGHEIMKHFHKPGDEKRSIVALHESQYLPWLNATHDEAKEMLQLAPDGFLASEPAPLIRASR